MYDVVAISFIAVTVWVAEQMLPRCAAHSAELGSPASL